MLLYVFYGCDHILDNVIVVKVLILSKIFFNLGKNSFDHIKLWWSYYVKDHLIEIISKVSHNLKLIKDQLKKIVIWYIFGSMACKIINE